MNTTVLSAGQSSTDLTLNPGDSEIVQSGGTANYTTVDSGGSITIQNGGVANDVQLNSGGQEIISAGGIVNGGNVASGGIITGLSLNYPSVDSGGWGVDSIVIDRGASVGLEIKPGGSLLGFTENFQTLTVDAGAAESGTTVNGGFNTIANTRYLGGTENVYGNAANDTVNGGTENIQFGGAVSGVTLNAGNLFVYNGGAATNSIVNSGSTEYDEGNTSGVTVNSGGTEVVYNSASSILVNSGGIMSLGSAGVVNDFTVNSGGQAIIGTVLSTITHGNLPGNMREVVDAGVLSGGNVNSGGMIGELVLTSGSLVIGSGAYQLDGVNIQNGASVGLYVDSGASTTGFIANSGGYERIASGAQAIDTTVNSGGEVDIYAGGSVSGGTVQSGGIITGLLVAGSSVDLGNASYVLDGVTIAQGAGVGVQVASGAGLSGFNVYQGGSEDVFGSAAGTTVNSGGSLIVEKGGDASGFVVHSGGTANVVSGGVTVGGTVESGGSITGLVASADKFIISKPDFSLDGVNIHSGASVGIEVAPGASISGFTVSSGGYLHVDANAHAFNTLVKTGGTELVSAGGIAFTQIQGGTVEYIGSAGSGSLVNFAGGGGSLVLDNPATYAGSVLGFGNGGSLTLKGLGSVYSLAWNKDVLAITFSDAKIIDISMPGQYQGDAFAVVNQPYYTAFGTGYNAVVSLVQPTISSVAYNATSGVLTLDGSNLSGTLVNQINTNSGSGSGSGVSGGGSILSGNILGFTTPSITPGGVNSVYAGKNYIVTDFTLKGDNGSSYTLTSGSHVLPDLTTGKIDIQLSAADQLAVDGLFNRSGTIANDGVTSYNLSSASGWMTGANGISTQSVTVSNVVPPVISAVGYNAVTGVFSFSGNHLVNHGAVNGIAVNDFSISKVAGNSNAGGNGTGGIIGGSGTTTGGGTVNISFSAAAAAVPANNTYSFDAKHDLLSNFSAGGFKLSLSKADQLAFNAYLTATGGNPLTGTIYQLGALAGWDSDTGAAISNQAVTINGLKAIATAAYDAASGKLTLTGSNFTPSATHFNFGILSADPDYKAADFTLSGENGGSYTLTAGSYALNNATATSVTIQLSRADQQAVDKLLNSSGQQALDGSAYALSAASGWLGGAEASGTRNITVSHAVTLQAVTINGTLVQLLVADGLKVPHSITLDGTGNLYIADTGDNLIKELTAQHKLVTVATSPLNAPNGVAVANGMVYFNSGNSIYQQALASHTSTAIAINADPHLAPGGISFSSPVGLVAYQGNIYFADQGTYYLVAVNGPDIEEIVGGKTLKTLVNGALLGYPDNIHTALKNPDALAFDHGGNLYIADAGDNSIKALPVGASSVTTLVSTGLNHPSGIAVDSAGNLYIADSGNNAIKELAVGSQTLTTILASGLNSPQGITIDSAGNLYVADTGNNEIKEIIHRSYFFNTAPNIEKPVIISDLWENTSQIQLSKAVFTALAGQGVINSTNFSNATSPESPTDYLYYNAGTGGLYYAADGSNLGKSPVEIAIIGVDSHPAALSPGDFKLIG